MWVVVIAVVVLAGVGAVLANRGDDPAPATGAVQETGPVTVVGTALPALAEDAVGLVDPATDPAVGAAIPSVTGEAFDGSPVVIGPDGGARVVVFVAHWCPHCRKEVPLITSWLAQGGSAGVPWAAISTSVDSQLPNYPPSAWLAGEHWPVTTLADSADRAAATAFGLPGFPYFVAVRADGTVAMRASGELTTEQLNTLSLAALG